MGGGKTRFAFPSDHVGIKQYILDTVVFATELVKYMSRYTTGFKYSNRILDGLRWFPFQSTRPILVTCAELPESTDSDLAGCTAAFKAKWDGATNLVDVDKAEHLRVAIPLCHALAYSILAQVHATPVTSKSTCARCRALLRVVEQGAGLTMVTNVELEARFRQARDFLTCGDPKRVLQSQVDFLAALLPLCTRMAAFVGAEADRDSVCGFLRLLGTLAVASPVQHASREKAIEAYKGTLDHYRLYNLPAVSSCNPQHAAQMLDVLCSVHHHSGVQDPALTDLLRGLRLEGDTVVYPPGYSTDFDSSHFSYGLEALYTMDPTPEENTRLATSLFHYTAKCLSHITKVTDDGLVQALARLRAYASQL